MQYSNRCAIGRMLQVSFPGVLASARPAVGTDQTCINGVWSNTVSANVFCVAGKDTPIGDFNCLTDIPLYETLSDEDRESLKANGVSAWAEWPAFVVHPIPVEPDPIAIDPFSNSEIMERVTEALERHGRGIENMLGSLNAIGNQNLASVANALKDILERVEILSKHVDPKLPPMKQIEEANAAVSPGAVHITPGKILEGITPESPPAATLQPDPGTESAPPSIQPAHAQAG